MPPFTGLQAVELNRSRRVGPMLEADELVRKRRICALAPRPRNRRARAPGSRQGQLGLEGGGGEMAAAPKPCIFQGSTIFFSGCSPCL